VRVVQGSGGGPEKTILHSPRPLLAAGYRMLCAYLHPPADPGFDRLRQRARALGAPLFSVDDRGPWDWQVIGKLLQICRRERVQIWHGHDYKSNALGLLLRQFWPMRLVTTVHGWVVHTRRTPLYYGIDRLCLRHYERVLCVSADLHEQCLRDGVAADRCLLVDNAIDPQAYVRRQTVHQAKQRLAMPAHRLLIGAVGRLSPEKGFADLIRATRHLQLQGLDVALCIAGEGRQETELRSLIAHLGGGDRVHLLGQRAELNELYEAMDVFALSSWREGLPNVLLEALALGVPAVATCVGGVLRLIEDEVTGLLVQPGSVAQLAAGLGRLLTDEALRQRLARHGRRRVTECFNFAARMEKIRAIYDDLLCRPGGQPFPRRFVS
jgi:glycosyltransferase involved in cell wall biosynthesis